MTMFMNQVPNTWMNNVMAHLIETSINQALNIAAERKSSLLNLNFLPESDLNPVASLVP